MHHHTHPTVHFYAIKIHKSGELSLLRECCKSVCIYRHETWISVCQGLYRGLAGTGASDDSLKILCFFEDDKGVLKLLWWWVYDSAHTLKPNKWENCMRFNYISLNPLQNKFILPPLSPCPSHLHLSLTSISLAHSEDPASQTAKIHVEKAQW